MKHWYRTHLTKTVCFLLCLFSLAVTVASIVGAVFFTEAEYYTRPPEYIWEEQAYSMLRTDAQVAVIHSIRMAEDRDVSSYYYYSGFTLDPQSTNVRVVVYDPAGAVAFTHVAEGVSSEWNFEFRFDVLREMTTMGHDDGLRVYYLYGDAIPEGMVYTVKAYLAPALPVADEYAHVHRMIDLGHALRFWVYPIGLLSLLVAVSCIVLLIVTAGRRPDTDALVPGPLHRVPFDLLVALTGVSFALVAYLFDELYVGSLLLDISAVIAIALAVASVLGLVMSASARIKCGTFLKNTVIWITFRLIFRMLRWFVHRLYGLVMRFVRLVKCLLRGLRAIPILWRTALLVLGLGLFDLVILALSWDYLGVALFLAVVEFVLVAVLALYAAWTMRRLQQGAAALAKGELNHQVDTAGMLWDFKCHGENLNRIGDGIACAVEQQLKSERMKAELVTNVSHDIKTPLTSIINYADLIAAESCNTEKHKEYAEVLLRKSNHLKRLLEDLVEISKANTGNLEVSLSPCDAGVLLTQTVGEFEEKCRSAGLELVTEYPNTSVRILVDSRRIWRVFENLMGNACKYSLPGSRIYLSLKSEGREARFTFRNTSRAALNVSPEELMERFVRGDAARATEGNGLGLSIARSLTELQGGRMELAIDGDLFKITLCFPLL